MTIADSEPVTRGALTSADLPALPGRTRNCGTAGTGSRNWPGTRSSGSTTSATRAARGITPPSTATTTSTSGCSAGTPRTTPGGMTTTLPPLPSPSRTARDRGQPPDGRRAGEARGAGRPVIHLRTPNHVHRMGGSVDSSVSIHAYSPPLWRMGQYAIGRNGVIRRMSVSYADELRPMDDESVIEKYKALQAVLQESAT